MTQRVEARFFCDTIELDKEGMGSLQMSAVYDEDGANKDFTEATPSGSIEMALDGNKTAAANFFKAGKIYRVIFEELTEEEGARESA